MKNRNRFTAAISFAFLVSHSSSFASLEGTLDLDEVPPKGVTRVWSPLFQASWDKLIELQDGEFQKVVPPNVLINSLQEFQWDEKKVLPADGYAVYAGPATRDFVRETAASIQKKFKVEIEPRQGPPGSGGKSAFGILLRDLKFQKNFFRSRNKALNFRSRTGDVHQVEFFGSAGNYSGAFGEHVKVLEYGPNGTSFTLSISTDREDEKLIIHRPKKECGFRIAMEGVKKAMKAPLSGKYGSLQDGSLHRKDVVKIPYLTVNADTNFADQLSGSLHFTGSPLPWNVAQAYQVTRFELFESGAKVQVVTGVEPRPFGQAPKPPPVVPRNFVCDQPFFVFIWKNDVDWPYFATWVDGKDCFKPFSKGVDGK